jgi:hypothetical protein
MKKGILIFLGLAAVTTATILIVKKMKKSSAPAATAPADQKKTIIDEIMAMPGLKEKVDIALTTSNLNKLTPGELASLKIMFTELMKTGESGLSAANKKIMAELIPKMLK